MKGNQLKVEFRSRTKRQMPPKVSLPLLPKKNASKTDYRAW